MTARITKLLLLFSGLAFSLSLAAQYPSNSIKSRLGYQTTGDGLVYRGSGAPAYSPGTIFNAWMYLDTTNFILYHYKNFQWTKLPLVNNGLTFSGSYVQLGGTLVQNTQVESNGYTLDIGKISGANKAYWQVYGSSPYYIGGYTTNGTSEVTMSIGNGVFNWQGDRSGEVMNFDGTPYGFSATYLGSFGAAQFKMDSARFRISGLSSYATHALATAGTVSNQLYQITDSRSIFINSGTGNKVSPNILDNNTYAGVISRPWKFGEYTTAGLPTGVTGYTLYNTTTNGLAWYQGSRWAYGLESTFNRGTSTYVPFFDVNGQLTQQSTFNYTPATSLLTITDGNGQYSPTITRYQQVINRRATTGGANAGLYVNSIQSISGLSGFVSGVRVDIGASSGGTSAIPMLAYSANFNIGNSSPSYWAGFSHTGNIWNGGTLSNPIRSFSADVTYNIAVGNTMDSHSGLYTSFTTQSTGTITNVYGVQIAPQTGNITNNWGVYQSGSLERNVFRGKTSFGSTTVPVYDLDGSGSTNAFGLPRGTVAERPIIIASTTPFRYNTDSTALEYGESVGTWRQIATRAYVQSSIGAISTANIGNSDLTLSGNRTLSGGGYDLLLDTDVTVGDSLTLDVAERDTVARDILVRNSSGVIGALPFLVHPDTLWNTWKGFGFGVNRAENYAGGQVTQGDTIGSFLYMTPNNAQLMVYSQLRSNGFYTSGDFSTGNTRARIRNYYSAASPADNSEFSIDNLGMRFFHNGSSYFQVGTTGILRADGYGTGAKEAADLSKTQSNYIAGFATDGTVLDYRIQRDTSTSDADFTVSATLLSTCQELFVSAEVTSGHTDTVCVILPLPSSTYANKKVHVFADDDNSTWWVAAKTLLGNGLYLGNPSGTKPAATNYVAVSTTTGFSGFTYSFTCTRRSSGTWHWVLMLQN